MLYKEGMRVSVVSGDGKTPLGFGTYTGEVDVHVFEMSDGSLTSMTDAEREPTAPVLAEMKFAGAVHHILEGNPRIVLDDGGVVYGCQVWWSPVREETHETATNP